VEALRQGLEMDGRGYNIFVVGEPGTGRTTAIRAYIEPYAGRTPPPPDLCYVNNFRDPDMPRAVTLPAGDGIEFKDDMHNLLSALRTKLPLLFDSEEFAERRRAVIDELKVKEQEIQKELEVQVTAASFAMVQVQMGAYTRPELVAVIEEKGVPISQLDKLVSDGKLSGERAEELKEKYRELMALLEATLKKGRAIEREIQLGLDRIAHELAEPLVNGQLSDLKERYPCQEVCAYLDEVRGSILSNLAMFAKDPDENEKEGSAIDPFDQYRVNVVVDNKALNGAPVIFETTPTYTNLFGLIEKVVSRSGEVKSDFTRIKPGSFLRANGGYLVLNAQDVLTEAGVWNTLKRTLRNRTIEVHTFEPLYGHLGSTALKPQSVRCDVKVVMVGDPHVYQLLYGLDPEFKQIFKIKSEFDSVMERNAGGRQSYATFIRRIVENERFPHFSASGVAGVLEFGVREAGKRKKLTTRFGVLCDVVREAAYVARGEQADLVTREHVEEALRRRIRRVSLVDDKLQEMIIEGLRSIETTGSVVGQVNGLAVYASGDHVFGKPTRITARVGMGQSGVLSIDREVKLTGSTHDKGVLILTGFMRSRYSTQWPLSLSATLCFEQSYSEVEGDSASSTEVYALLSALSGVGIQQGVAVTGSVDQMGNVQPVGGINEKIEGFYRVCEERGLTGSQGVLIPARNVEDLMVSTDVATAVEEGRFSIWAVDHIDQGIEVLTGRRAGFRNKSGTFQRGSINYLVTKKLRELAFGLKRFDQEKRRASTTHRTPRRTTAGA
jgi:ATP-dependent Lon protease